MWKKKSPYLFTAQGKSGYLKSEYVKHELIILSYIDLSNIKCRENMNMFLVRIPVWSSVSSIPRVFRRVGRCSNVVIKFPPLFCLGIPGVFRWAGSRHHGQLPPTEPRSDPHETGLCAIFKSQGAQNRPGQLISGRTFLHQTNLHLSHNLLYVKPEKRQFYSNLCSIVCVDELKK